MAPSTPASANSSEPRPDPRLELSGHIWAAQQNTARIVTKTGGGELIITGANTTADDTDAATHGRPCYSLNTGTFNISAGTLTLRGAGTLNGGIAIQISPNTTLKLDNTAQVVPDRVPNSGVYSMTQANLQLLGNATASSSQTLTSLSFDGGMSTITVSQPTSGNGSTTTLGLTGTLGRGANRGTGLILGVNNVNSLLTASGGLAGMSPLGGGGAAGSKTISILPPIVGDASPAGGGSDFVTLDGTSLRPLSDANGEYQELSADNGLTTQNNTKVSSNTTIASTTDTQVNSVKISSGKTLTIGSGHRLTVNSGGILAVGASPSTISGGNLAFEQYEPKGVYDEQNPGNTTIGAYATDPFQGPAVGVSDGVIAGTSKEAVFTVPSGTTLVQDASNVIAGAQGLTKSGGGTLQLFGNNTFGGSRAYYNYDGNRPPLVPATSALPSPSTPADSNSTPTPTSATPRHRSSSTAVRSRRCNPTHQPAASPCPRWEQTSSMSPVA